MFEVASVKPNESVTGPAMLAVPPRGMVVATGYPALWLVRYAYDLRSSSQIVGDPDWLRHDRFDITAMPPDGASSAEVPLMMRALLQERFGLRARWETREQPVYALTIARQDGRLGPDIRPSEHDCAAWRSAGAAQVPEPLDDDGRSLCGRAITVGAEISTTLGGAYISELVAWLETWADLDRMIVDETALNGTFDIHVSFARRWSNAPPAATNAGARDTLDVWRSLPERLGLRLESRNADVRVLVIDAVERPVPD